MQYRPSASELLVAIAEVLEGEVLPVAPAEVQHKVRVAANLARIVSRELDLAPDADQAEAARLHRLLGHDGPIGSLEAELAEGLRVGSGPDPDLAWAELVEICRSELAVAKPGHDRWEGR